MRKLRYSCWREHAESADLWVVVIVMSSAYEAMFVFVCGSGVGMLCMYKLKRVGESTEPCGTPFGKLQILDSSFWKDTYPCRPAR